MSRRTGPLVAAVLFVLVVASGPAIAIVNAQAQHNTQARETQASRVASCWQARHATFTVRAGERKEIRFVISAIVQGSRRPPSDRALTAFYAGYDTVVRETNPLRDCSPAGIAAFLHLPPPGGSE